MSNTSPKYCFLEPDLGQIVITLTADDEFIAGGDFKIFDSETKDVLEEWKLTADFGKPSIYKVKTKPEYLHKMKFIFNVLTCTKNANRYEGRVAIKILQKGKPCKTSNSTSYLLYNVPPCALKSAEDFQSSLFFIIKEKLEEEKIEKIRAEAEKDEDSDDLY